MINSERAYPKPVLDPFSLERLDRAYRAYRACRRHKRGTINALRFEARLLDHLVDLRDELVSRTYHPSTSICFVQKRPKLREIFAADFRDRVVHHLLVGQLEPVFERAFIHDSYACRRNKGVHAAVTRLRSFLHKVTANGTVRAWYLKEDITGFFMNIDKRILHRLLCRRCPDEALQWLAAVLIFHDCTGDFHFKGDPRLLRRVPAHKTLFQSGGDRGLPIGNLTSQFFANVYLNELDQFVKRQLKCRHYLRYCDDFLLLGRDPEELRDWHRRIESFLDRELGLRLNPGQYRLRPVADGIDFLGYVVRRRYVLVRRRVVNHFRERLNELEGKCAERRQGEVTAWNYDPRLMEGIRATVASYLGHFQWADSRRLIAALYAKSNLLRAAFILHRGSMIPRWLQGRPCRVALVGSRAAGARRPWQAGSEPLPLRRAYRWWVPAPRRPIEPVATTALRPLWTGPEKPCRVLVLFPVGRFYEFYEEQAELARQVLGLRMVTGLRGFRQGCGFHRRWLGRFLRRALTAGCHVALLRAERGYDGRVRRRLAKLFKDDGPIATNTKVNTQVNEYVMNM